MRIIYRMKIIKISIFISFSFIIQNVSFANSNKKIEKLVHYFMNENRVEGLSIAILNNEKINTFNYGFADDLKKIPITNNTIYTIASFTKTFTGTLGAIAAVDKKLDLDTPFRYSIYIPVKYNKAIEACFATASLKSTITDMSKYLNAHINYSAIKELNISKAILLAHENKYCFEDNISCEQLSWQSHIISELKNSTGDTYFIKFDKNGTPIFYSKKIIKKSNFVKNKIFIDKTGSGYGMSSYIFYIPDEKKGVVILINKSIGDSRIKFGRDILRNL